MVDIPIFPYTAVQLTGTMQRIPNVYGLLNDLNLFPKRSITSRIVEIRRENGVLSVLSAKERGAPASVAARNLGNSIYLECPHFPFEDLIRPEDLQSMLQVTGPTAAPRTLPDEMARRLLNIRRHHAITLEWLRMSSLLGNITDGDGNTIYNPYTVFGIAQTTIDFLLGTATTDVTSLVDQLYATIQANLLGETMDGIEIIASPSWFNQFISHPNVIKFFVNFEGKKNGETGGAAAQVSQERVKRGGQWGRVFEYQGLTIREYKGYAPVRVGGVLTTTPFMAANTAIAYPAGTQDMFATYFAPANDIRYVNTPGEEIYISPEILDHGKGVSLLTESDPLPICRRPEAVVLLQSSTSPAPATPPMPVPGGLAA